MLKKLLRPGAAMLVVLAMGLAVPSAHAGASAGNADSRGLLGWVTQLYVALTGESGSTLCGESGSNLTGESGSNLTGESGSNLTGESGSNLTGESGSN